MTTGTTAITRSSTAAVVTGGASGLGRATAEALAVAGVKVAIFDVNAEKGEEVAKAMEEGVRFAEGLTPLAVETDRHGQLVYISQTVAAKLGRPATPGGADGAPELSLLEESELEQQLATNLTAEAVTRTGRSFGDVTPQRLASLAFLLAILLGTAWALHSTWRLYRWTRGRELRCACGGMMSRVRYNRQRQKYRKCLACGGKTLEGAHCGGT